MPDTAPARTAPPEARLIARLRRDLNISSETAAGRMRYDRISGRRWRQIEDGAEYRGGPRVTARAEQLAEMARVVEATPQQLADTGRPDVAEKLTLLRDKIRADDVRRAARLDTAIANITPDQVRRLVAAADAEGWGQQLRAALLRAAHTPPRGP